MKFGEFIRKRRKQFGWTQKQVVGFEQGALSKIENGQYPTKREIIADLARALQFKEEQVDWLWIYALLDRDPYDYFAIPAEPQHYRESPNNMYCTDIKIELNASEDDVLAIMGPPDKKMSIPSRTKWIYQSEGVHVIFANGKVVDVMFK